MSLTVKIGEAKTRLSELLAKVEAGEEIVIARGDEPIARLTRIPKAEDFAALIAEVKAARAKRAKTSPEELLAWRDEGRGSDGVRRRRLDCRRLVSAGRAQRRGRPPDG